MKKSLYLITLLLAGSPAAAAQSGGEAGCDCPACAAKTNEFTLPGLEGLQADAEEVRQPVRPAEPEPAPAVHAVPHDHDNDGIPDHDSQADHDHGAREHEAHLPHDDLGHGSHAGDGCAAACGDPDGIEIREAAGGTVAVTTVLPAEIKLNRDTTVAVSARYPSLVRQVFAEIGDTVGQGDILAALENRETMSVYTVAAPQDGVIISKNLAPGEAAAEDRVLYEVADLSSVWADISVFPRYRHQLRKGMAVQFIAHDGHTADGFIQYISPIVSHETRTFTARCVLEGAESDFTPGAFVRARVHLEDADAAVLVPRAAVQVIDGESMVFVPDEGGFSAVDVRLGAADEHHVAVLSGLEPGDAYVAAGAFALKAEIITGGMDPHAGHGH
jgi:cobalt-zinc-cadmium efflux system membrane fusion protein